MQRISIYFIADVHILILIGFSLLYLILVVKYKATMNVLLHLAFSNLLMFLFVFKFMLLIYYPNIPRNEIGWFYQLPVGKSIDYPYNANKH